MTFRNTSVFSTRSISLNRCQISPIDPATLRYLWIYIECCDVLLVVDTFIYFEFAESMTA
jgi:hypothetical protein